MSKRWTEAEVERQRLQAREQQRLQARQRLVRLRPHIAPPDRGDVSTGSIREAWLDPACSEQDADYTASVLPCGRIAVALLRSPNGERSYPVCRYHVVRDRMVPLIEIAAGTARGRSDVTRRRDCTCAGTAPGYPQHEDWCGQPERPYEPDDEPVQPKTGPELLRQVTGAVGEARRGREYDGSTATQEVGQLHSVPTTGGDEQKPSLSDCLRANGIPRQHWDTVSAAVAVWMRAWFHDVLDDEPDPDGAA